jgi:hypothetical protein
MLSSMKLNIMLLTVGLLCAACSSAEPLPEQDLSLDDLPPPSGPAYVENFGRLPVRGPMILFFSKVADPFSERSDAVLRSVYGSGAALFTTYRLDLGSSTGAKLKYAVFTEDTFVSVSGSGTVQSIVHPSAQQIRELLKTGRISQ